MGERLPLTKLTALAFTSWLVVVGFLGGSEGGVGRCVLSRCLVPDQSGPSQEERPAAPPYADRRHDRRDDTRTDRAVSADSW